LFKPLREIAGGFFLFPGTLIFPTCFEQPSRLTQRKVPFFLLYGLKFEVYKFIHLKNIYHEDFNETSTGFLLFDLLAKHCTKKAFFHAGTDR